MNGKTVRRSGMAFLVLLACGGLTGCNYSSTSTTESVPQTGIALLRYTASGALDTSFGGGDGIVVTDIEPSQYDFAIAAALQPADGKIVVVGRSVLGTQGVIALLRYNADGTLDTTTFGNNSGIVRTPVGLGNVSATAVALQPLDGKILVAGITFTASTGTTGIALVRYNTNGALDTTFGALGIVTAAIGSGSEADTASLALQADGKIVVAGATSTGNFVLRRYDSSGVLDQTFGTGGITTTTVGASAMSPAIALQSDGKIVAAGGSGSFANPPINAVLVRYNINGVLDTSFGGVVGGIVSTDIALSNNFSNAIVVQLDDKIVVAGHAFVDFSANTSDIALLRYSPDGTLDTSFSGDGIVVTDVIGFDNALSIALQPVDGKIVVSGNVDSGLATRSAVLRYTANGTLDSTFGPGGSGFVTASAIGPSTVASANAVVLQPNGSIVVVGYD